MQQIVDDSSSSYFFLMSGENPDLAAYEFLTLLDVISRVLFLDYDVDFSHDKRIATLKIQQGDKGQIHDFLSRLMKRVTMVHFCCKLYLQTGFVIDEGFDIETMVRSMGAGFLTRLDPQMTFSISIKVIGEINEIVNAQEINSRLCIYLGRKIQEIYQQKQVDLTNPEEEYVGVVTEKGFWFGLLFGRSQRKEVRKRAAHKRPFFHPSSMNPILQRTMINLAGLKEDEWLLDPFCGTGGSLIEAARLRLNAIGIEIDRKILWGAHQNIAEEVDRDRIHLILGDALHLCVARGSSIMAIVTDPPYGTAASTKGLSLESLLIKFFGQIANIIRPGTRIVMAVPSNVEIESKASEILNASYKRFYQFVHRSLTRKILVFTKH